MKNYRNAPTGYKLNLAYWTIWDDLISSTVQKDPIEDKYREKLNLALYGAIDEINKLEKSYKREKRNESIRIKARKFIKILSKTTPVNRRGSKQI